MILVFSVCSFAAVAQEQKTFSEAEGTVIEVKGTSTLHDWNMESRSADITAQFTLEGGELKKLNSLSFSLPVKSLKSGTSGLDEDAYEALKAEQHPRITFEMRDAAVSASGENNYKVNGRGTLTVAGVSREISIKANCKQTEEGLTCTGGKKIDMRDFNIEPPSAMFGALKAGEEVTVKFAVILK